MRPWLLLFFLLPVWAQALPPGGGVYTYSDGTEQRLLPLEGGFRLLYLRGGRVYREDRMALREDGVYLLGLVLGGVYTPYEPPLLLYPARILPGAQWGGSARFGSDRVALVLRAEGVEGLRVPAGAYNAWRLALAYTTGQGGVERKEVYFVPGLGPVAYRVGGVRVELLRFSPP